MDGLTLMLKNILVKTGKKNLHHKNLRIKINTTIYKNIINKILGVIFGKEEKEKEGKEEKEEIKNNSGIY